MRVVIFQGQYGIFNRKGLDLSMPGVQSCLGLYALSTQHDYILCAHFDTELRLRQNLLDINQALEAQGINMRSFRATVFGGDGKQSYFRCNPPSSHIGNKIVDFIKEQGGMAEYSNHFYSGLVPKTFNFHYKGGCGITEGQNMNDFMGCNQQAASLARKRIRIRPSEYSITHAKMVDISFFY